MTVKCEQKDTYAELITHRHFTFNGHQLMYVERSNIFPTYKERRSVSYVTRNYAADSDVRLITTLNANSTRIMLRFEVL